MNNNEFTDVHLDIPLKEGIVLRRENGTVFTNVPHLCVHHSPTGFEFGYGGSGPADLALNMVQAVLVTMGYQGETTPLFNGRCFHLAWELHQSAKWEFIALMPQAAGGEISYDALVNWIVARNKHGWTSNEAPETD